MRGLPSLPRGVVALAVGVAAGFLAYVNERCLGVECTNIPRFLGHRVMRSVGRLDFAVWPTWKLGDLVVKESLSTAVVTREGQVMSSRAPCQRPGGQNRCGSWLTGMPVGSTQDVLEGSVMGVEACGTVPCVRSGLSSTVWWDEAGASGTAEARHIYPAAWPWLALAVTVDLLWYPVCSRDRTTSGSYPSGATGVGAWSVEQIEGGGPLAMWQSCKFTAPPQPRAGWGAATSEPGARLWPHRAASHWSGAS